MSPRKTDGTGASPPCNFIIETSIDGSDDEDFPGPGYIFSLTPKGGSHQLNIVEGQPQETTGDAVATDYTFSINLLDASQNGQALEVWQSGTLTLDGSGSVSGVLTLPGFYKEPIPFTGSTVPPSTEAGTTIVASGRSSEAQLAFTITYNYDGFLYSGSYLGGMVSILDFGAQETYLYVIQGLTSQGPSGAAFRGAPGAPDKRTARSA